MTPEKWRRLQSLFDEAMALAPDRRDAFLDEACLDDTDLRRQAVSLILASEDATSRIEGAIRSAAERISPQEGLPASRQRIGAYQVIQELGQGGMGAVYLAVRADEEFRKRVAIKTVRQGMADAEVLRRFRDERQILAGLDHPNIARLLDGGTTADGMPYVVMEYVEGEPIGRYCENRRLTIEERLELFRNVCAAVHYAHQNLVIHRDIKPGNILVTAAGVPKLLDFGIAKLLNPELASQEQAVTRAAMRLMTPEYASPEQIRGEPITTASDIYSLGVVLYELLTGHRPHRLKNQVSGEIERVISREEPPRPSTVISRKNIGDRASGAAAFLAGMEARDVKKLRRRLAGELDDIVMMAIRKEPQRRYSSAEQMSDDIRRHLQGQPVRARPDTIGYRAAKFVSRHRLGAAAAALILLTLIGGILATAWQARVAQAERSRAERRFNDLRKLAHSFIFDVHDDIAALPGSTRARESLVRSALEYLNRLAQESGNAPDLRRELAQAYQRVGDVQGNPTNANLGDTAGALASYRKALAIAEPLAAGHPTDVETRKALALTYQKLGDLQAWTGDPSGAVESVRNSLALFESVAQAAGTDAKARQSVAIGHIKLGDILGNPMFPNSGDRAEALREYELSLALWESLKAADPNDAATRRYLGLVHERIGVMLQEQGDLGRARESYRRSLAIREAIAGDNQANTEARRDLAVAYEKIAGIQTLAGDLREAEEHSRKSLAIFEALSAADPNNVNASRSLSISYEKMGDLLLRGNDLPGSLDYHRKSLAIREALLAAGPANVQVRRDVARSYSRLGATGVAMASQPGALPDRRASLWRQAEAFYQRSLDYWLDLRNRGVLRGDDVEEPDRIAAELMKCRTALAKLPKIPAR